MVREGDENRQTTLDDSAAIYTKRETKTGQEQFKSLKGAEKWQFFKDYILMKLLGILALSALIIAILYTMFKPKPDTLIDIAVLDCPFTQEMEEKIVEELNGIYVKNPKKEAILFDTDYYLTSDTYQSRMKLVTRIAANELDCVILPESEFNNCLSNESIASMKTVFSEDQLEAMGDKIVYTKPEIVNEGGLTVGYGDEDAYALDITPLLCELYDMQVAEKYYVAILITAPHTENIAPLFKYFVGKM